MNAINMEKVKCFYLCNETNKIFKRTEPEDASEFFITESFYNKLLVVICQGCFKYF